MVLAAYSNTVESFRNEVDAGTIMESVQRGYSSHLVEILTLTT